MQKTPYRPILDIKSSLLQTVYAINDCTGTGFDTVPLCPPPLANFRLPGPT
ncbi:hypothetical protein CPter91_4668 [Collimonas pratensis]|uniref:Uncharacterized protein n=1 Tax=Collimonas pratensis TaxID=279113 RepID=A0A127QA79_9BURK|nr:hypothetical protein CPter91_4668 [Collimonas pratensis]